MQMIHPMWPVVRESARRAVRLERIVIVAGSEYSDQIRDLADKISEHLPQRATFPEHTVTDEDDIWLYDASDGNSEPVAYLGMIEPSLDVCWIEMAAKPAFDALIESCLQLLSAGYPGCIGCDDTIQEGRWNEENFRIKRRKNEQ